MNLTQCVEDTTSQGGTYVLGKDQYINPICAYTTYGTAILKFDGSLKKFLFKLYEYPAGTLAKASSNPFQTNHCKIATDLEKCLLILKQEKELSLASLEKQENVLKLKNSYFLQGISVFPKNEANHINHSQPVRLSLKKLINPNLNGAFFGSLLYYLEDLRPHVKTVDLFVTDYSENAQTFTILTSPIVKSDIGGSFPLNNFIIEKNWRELDLEQVRAMENEILFRELLEIKNNVCGLEVVNTDYRLRDPSYIAFCQVNDYICTTNPGEVKDVILFAIIHIISNGLQSMEENQNQSLLTLVKAVWLDFSVPNEISKSGVCSILKSFELIYRCKIITGDDMYFLLKELQLLVSERLPLFPSDFKSGILLWKKDSLLREKFNCGLTVKMSMDVCAYAVISGLFETFSAICVTPAAAEMKSNMIDTILPLYDSIEGNFFDLVVASKDSFCHPLFETHCIDVIDCSIDDVVKVLAYMAMKILLTLALYVRDQEFNVNGSIFPCVKAILLEQVLKTDTSNQRICTNFYPFVEVLQLRISTLMNGYMLKSWLGYKSLLAGESNNNDENIRNWLLNSWQV